MDLVGEEFADLPIGIMEGVEYQAFTFELQEGESLTMYTDGLNEAENGSEELFGIEAIQQIVEQYDDAAEARGERILNAVLAHSEGEVQGDDMCLVAFNRLTMS